MPCQPVGNPRWGAGPQGCGAALQSSAVDLPRTSTRRISHFPDPPHPTLQPTSRRRKTTNDRAHSPASGQQRCPYQFRQAAASGHDMHTLLVCVASAVRTN